MTTLLNKEPMDVLASDPILYSLVDGAGATVTLAAAGATWRLMRSQRTRHKTQRQLETAEVKALRSIVDGVMVFLVGKDGENGLPDTPGFVNRFDTFEDEVRRSIGGLTEAVNALVEQGGTHAPGS